MDLNPPSKRTAKAMRVRLSPAVLSIVLVFLKEFIMQARQGDIFFKTVKNIPNNLKKKTDNILAYGEVTGHSHKIMSPSISEMQSFVDENGDIYVLSEHEDIKIGHDEHDVITLPKNEWICVSRQREFNALESSRESLVRD